MYPIKAKAFEGFYSVKEFKFKNKKYETGLVKKSRHKNLVLLCIKSNLTFLLPSILQIKTRNAARLSCHFDLTDIQLFKAVTQSKSNT